MGQRRTLHNDQRISPRRWHNNFKYLCTQHRFTTIYEANANNLKRTKNNNNTIIVGYFNTPLTAMDRSSRQKINKETQALNDIWEQMDWTGIYGTFHLKATEYTFFSSAHRTFFKIEHILGHKSSLSNFKKTEIIPSIFSDHNTTWLEINNKEKTAKNTNTWRLNNMLLNNQWIKEEIKKYT